MILDLRFFLDILDWKQHKNTEQKKLFLGVGCTLQSDYHWQEGLSSCGRTDWRLGHKILAKARRKLLWQSGYRKGLMAEFSQRSQKVTSYQWCPTQVPLQAARMIMRSVYGAQHTPKTHTITANDLAIFLSLERRACPALLEGAHAFEASCARIIRVRTQPLNNPRFLIVAFIVKDTECVLLGSPLDDGETSSSLSSRITAEMVAGSLDETLRVLTKNTEEVRPSMTLQPSSFSTSMFAMRVRFLRWMLR